MPRRALPPRLLRSRGALVAVGALAWGAAVLRLHDLTDVDRSASNSHGEDVIFIAFLVVTGVFGAVAAAMEGWRPPARLARIRPDVALGVVITTWMGFWAVLSVVRDPAWAPSGIDWHDSYLAAYGLHGDDAALYCASRYPLFPSLGGLLHRATSSGLDVSLQLVSRAEMLLLALPLAHVARQWFGRTVAAAMLVLMACVPTFQHHLDAVTPYPGVILFSTTLVAALVAAVRGGLLPFLVAGVATGATLAAEAKGLALALTTLPLALLFALGAPTGGGLVRAAGLRLVRIGLLVAPIALSYAWMGSLPIQPLSLEQLASPTILPPTMSEQEKRPYLQDGYVWGKFTTPDQPWKTIQTFQRLRELPGQAAAHRAHTHATRSKLVEEYPGSSLRPLLLAAVGLILVPLRRLPDRRAAVRAAVELTPLLAVGISVLPAIADDYQDRYVAHAVIWVPLLLAGVLDAIAGLVVGSGGAARGVARTLALFAVAAGMAAWPGFPLSVPRILPRLEPVMQGGESEQAVRAWARETMQPGDVLMDVTWLMMGALVAGEHTVLRQPNTWPPAGAPTDDAGWRASRPWVRPSGTLYALGALAGEPPVPQGVAWTAQRIGADSRWRVVWTSPDGMLNVWRFSGPGLPEGVRLPARLPSAG